MAYSPEEQINVRLVKDALAGATEDFGKFGEAIFSEDVAWTITG